MTFQDHFSARAAQYAKYRPGYPPELFEWLAGLAPARHLAWDVGTGSGQAAHELAQHFDRVIASDAAAAQLHNATPHERIVYRVMPAERAELDDASVDLVTIAQALHWFDFDRFYGEVRRVLRPGGVIAAWTYGISRVAPEVDELVHRYYGDIVGPYWPPERAHVEQQYRSIPFPFEEIATPPFSMRMTWRVEDMLGYLGTWSASKRYAEARGEDPLARMSDLLARAWGEGRERTVEWPLYLRAGRPTQGS